jgi:hypothetical protein
MTIMAQAILAEEMVTYGTRRRSTPCKPLSVTISYRPCDSRVEDVPMPDLAEDELLVRIKACGIHGSAPHQRDPLEALIGLTDGPWPIVRFEVKWVMPIRLPILAIFQVITQG